MTKSKTSPKDGDYIDLDKSDFKKKKNFFKKSLFYFILFIFFFFAGFITYTPFKNKYFPPENLKKSNLLKENFETKLSRDDLQNLENDISILLESFKDLSGKIKKIEENNRRIENVQNDNLRALSEINQYNPEDKFLLDFKKNRILTNFLIFKKNFLSRDEFGNELDSMERLFINNDSIISKINFFKNLDILDLKRKSHLIDLLNEKLISYEREINDLILDIENDVLLEKNNIFKSKDEFIKYLKSIFDANFKIVKFENKEENFKNDSEKIFPVTLNLSKEYLLADNLDKSIMTIRDSGLDETDFYDWLLEAEKIKEAEENFNDLETLIFDKLRLEND
jgi:hypothetical protein